MSNFSITNGALILDGEAEKDIEYRDGCETFLAQPGICWGRYYWITADNEGTTQAYTEHPTGLSTPMFDISAFSSGNDYRQDHYRAVADKPERVGGKNIPINDQTLDAIRETLQTARDKGVLCIPRFSYARDAYSGTEPDDVAWIVKHIEQLAAVVNEYKDIVIAIEAGMMGPWGEMHCSKYIQPEYSNIIIGAMLDNYDESIPILCRNPGLIKDYAESKGATIMESLPLTPDHPAYRLGMYNDGYLGTDTDYGTWLVLDRNEGRQFLASQNSRMPYGGEMAHTKVEFLADHKSPIYEKDFFEELYQTRLSYLRNILTDTTGLQKVFEVTDFTHDTDFDGMPDVSEYYGGTWQKFILDHMGYRFVLRYSFTCGGAFEGYIENTGFGSVPDRLKAEIILEGEDGICALPVDMDLNDGHYAFTVSAEKPGQYRAYIRISAVPFEKADADTRVVRFANPHIFDSDLGANYIGTLDL
ncbi:MAG: DUF4874 domain-containing protein [Clostridia bacterium]|nr:DUF4874 domain-containing protein [Clostridia bacterium]